jgi:hypothetical protein
MDHWQFCLIRLTYFRSIKNKKSIFLQSKGGAHAHEGLVTHLCVLHMHVLNGSHLVIIVGCGIDHARFICSHHLLFLDLILLKLVYWLFEP